MYYILTSPALRYIICGLVRKYPQLFFLLNDTLVVSIGMCNSIIFLYSPRPFNSLSPAVYKLLYALRKKYMYICIHILSRVASHACIASFTFWAVRNGGFSKLLCVDQTGDCQKKTDQDYTRIVLKICDVFLPLVHLQPIKIVSLHAALLCSMKNVEQ
jgi:hypothetical protein